MMKPHGICEIPNNHGDSRCNLCNLCNLWSFSYLHKLSYLSNDLFAVCDVDTLLDGEE